MIFVDIEYIDDKDERQLENLLVASKYSALLDMQFLHLFPYVSKYLWEELVSSCWNDIDNIKIIDTMRLGMADMVIIKQIIDSNL